MSAGTVYLALSMAPGSMTQLTERVTMKGRTMEDISIPVCAVKIPVSGSCTAVNAKQLPTPESPGLSKLKGWGVAPLILVTAEEARPDSEEIRKEMWALLGKSRGHNNVSKLKTFYTEEDDVTWPDTESKVLGTHELWPEWQQVSGGTAASTPGRKLPKHIEGSKYSTHGGYKLDCISPAIKGVYANELVKVANHALATNTWRTYSTVWSNIDNISKETGIKFANPISLEMVQSVLGFYVVKGLKASTIRNYVSSLKQGHAIRGLKCEALNDKFLAAVCWKLELIWQN